MTDEKRFPRYDIQELITFARLWLSCRATSTMVWNRNELTNRVQRLDNNAIFPKISSTSLLLKNIPLTTSVIALTDNTMLVAMRNVQYGIDGTIEYCTAVENIANLLIRYDKLGAKYDVLLRNVTELRDIVQESIEIVK